VASGWRGAEGGLEGPHKKMRDLGRGDAARPRDLNGEDPHPGALPEGEGDGRYFVVVAGGWVAVCGPRMRFTGAVAQ